MDAVINMPTTTVMRCVEHFSMPFIHFINKFINSMMSRFRTVI